MRVLGGRLENLVMPETTTTAVPARAVLAPVGTRLGAPLGPTVNRLELVLPVCKLALGPVGTGARLLERRAQLRLVETGIQRPVRGLVALLTQVLLLRMHMLLLLIVNTQLVQVLLGQGADRR